MVWLLTSVFGAGFLTLFIDEFLFHRTRGLNKAERLWHPINNFMIALACSLVTFVPYSQKFMWGFGLLAVFSVFTKTREQIFLEDPVCTKNEHWLHGFTFVLHPLVLLSLGFLWPFINGVGLFMGAVLPFSTWGFKFLGYSATAAFAALSVFQFLKWKVFFKEEKTFQEINKAA